jgi:cation transporter-like permease
MPGGGKPGRVENYIRSQMKLSLTLIALAVGLAYGIVVQYFPDFPVSQDVLLAFVVYVLIKLGVEIVEPAVRAFLVRRGLQGFRK